MRKRVVYFVLCLLLMCPVVGAYADNGLLSKCPSEAKAGEEVKFDIAAEDVDLTSLEITSSPDTVEIRVSDGTVTMLFNQAGEYTITAKAGELTDECTVSVTNSESGADDSSEETNPDEKADPDDQTTPDDQNQTGSDQKQDQTQSGDNDKQKQNKDGASAKQSAAGAVSAAAGSGASGSASAGSSSADSKTTYTGSANNYLSSLKVKGHKFSQSFHKTNNTYFLQVDSDTESIAVNAVAEDSDADVTITGTDDLSIGRNKVMVSVTAENGDVRVYRIIVDVK